MLLKNAILLGVAGLFLGAIVIGQGATSSQTEQKTTIKKVPITESEVTSGKQMFQDYCAACHGMDGKGNGPAASALACKPLPDLTTIAKRNNKKSAEPQVRSVLEFGAPSKAHGTPEMPIWGPMFRSLSGGSGIVQLRIKNLSDYVDSIQEK
jgi:mono/diheme cytochrome c family protein